MTLGYLDFEQPILELEQKIEEFRRMEANERSLDIQQEIEQLQTKTHQLIGRIFSDLSPWQVAQLARHPHRAYFLDYVQRIFTEFEELHGDRNFADDPAIICGIARFNDQPVAVIGQQKGRDVKEKVRRNFGMPRPEGYRKALRVMSLAERYGMPIFTFIDTPGAYPGIGAEERGQSEAIAKNLLVMSGLKVPIISTVIGEGGSGGALAIGVGDHLNMLQYSTYSVISPEGCASILWKSAEYAPNAAESMGLTAERLHSLGLVDTVIDEPLGGVHRDFDLAAFNVANALNEQLDRLSQWSPDELLANRRERLLNLGRTQYSEKSLEKTKERRAKLRKKSQDRASESSSDAE